MSHRRKVSFSLPVLALFLFVAVLAILGFVYLINRSRLDPSTSPVEMAAPTVEIQPPPHLDRPLLFYEDSIYPYPFAPDAYPAYAEAAPTAPCATWENGGLEWRFFAFTRPARPSWVAFLQQPEFRFCGFPQPIPQKPAKPTAIPLIPATPPPS